MPTLLVFGARNLGGAIAEHFAAQGWSVAGAARSEETAARLRERIPDALGLTVDVTQRDQVGAAADAARERFGSLDLIVNAVSPGMRSQGQFGGGPLIDS